MFILLYLCPDNAYLYTKAFFPVMVFGANFFFGEDEEDCVTWHLSQLSDLDVPLETPKAFLSSTGLFFSSLCQLV